MNKELEQIVAHNDRTEGDRWSRFAALMTFASAILYFLLF